MKLIYDPLGKEIAHYLQNNKPSPKHGTHYHQWFTSNYGLGKLIHYIYKIISLAQYYQTMKELKNKVEHQYKH